MSPCWNPEQMESLLIPPAYHTFPLCLLLCPSEVSIRGATVFCSVLQVGFFSTSSTAAAIQLSSRSSPLSNLIFRVLWLIRPCFRPYSWSSVLQLEFCLFMIMSTVCMMAWDYSETNSTHSSIEREGDLVETESACSLLSGQSFYFIVNYSE